jgi:hypothetical protein
VSFLVRTYECPECSRRIELLQTAEEGPPRFCGYCGTDFGEAEPVPGTHAIGGSNIARATDGMYRELETTSAARAEALNAPHLKITDLNDRLREGDVAAKAPDNTVTRFQREAKAGVGANFGWGGGFSTPGARVAPPIPSGVPGQAFTGPGHIALAGAQGDHQQRVAQIVANPSAKPYVSGR